MLRALSASSCCCACATEAPGLSRPIIDQLLLCRESSDRSSAVNDSGTHNLISGSTNVKSAGRMPMIVYGSLLIRMVEPTVLSLAAKSCCQSP